MIPEGWTDDMTVPLPLGKTADDLVEFVIQRGVAHTPDAQTEQDLVTTFGLSVADAALVRDRVFGGIVRAATGNSANRPSSLNDPFAFHSFERASREPSIIAAIYPQYAAQAEKLAKKRYVPAIYSRPPEEAPRRAWWQFWKPS